ncbi:MAG: hypothetical protein SGI84_03210 [Gemmatimonadota bacterium]|nr:hypothetical protein [Gemmatimonadota bacterium]
MSRFVLRHLALATALVGVPATLLEAQGEPERGGPTVIMIVPYAGVSIPTHTLLVATDGEGGWEARTGYVLGARLQIPIRPRLEAHADIGYARSRVQGIGSSNGSQSGYANFLGVSARLAYQITPVRRRGVSVALNAGGGWIRHWIASPQPAISNWPAAVAGVQVGVPFIRGVRLTLGAESWLYNAKFDGPDPVKTGQQDFRITVGVSGGR